MLPPLSPANWNFRTAAQLLNRAGFGGSPGEISQLQSRGLTDAVQCMLHGVDDSAHYPNPTWAVPVNKLEKRRALMAITDSSMREMSRKELQKGERKESMQELLDLRTQWLSRMADGTDPLREKMVLFWHGHFATSMEKVRDSYLIWRQNAMFRKNALGNFELLTKQLTRDPAMMAYLDLDKSTLSHPNENFARELMELFTLGEGNYSEEDIRESARAFTGYRIDPRDQSYRFANIQHDAGEKSFLGKKGKLTGDDVVEQILSQPACAKFICAKLWSFFAFEDPEPGIVDALAKTFCSQKFEIKPVLTELFSSQAFYSPKAYRTQVKSPVQWLVQTSKVLEAEIPSGMMVQNALRQLGQTLFAPPSVKGWDGGKAWISTSTLLFRYNLANALLNGNLASLNDKVQPRRFFKSAPFDVSVIIPPWERTDSRKLVDSLTLRLFQDPLGPRENALFLQYLDARKPDMSDDTIRGLLHLMMSTPQYQLC